MTRVLLLLALRAACFLGYRYWASDQRQIRRLLDDVADAVSQAEGEGGVAGLAEITSLNGYLTTDVSIEATLPTRAAGIRGVSEVVSTVGRFRAVFPVLTLSFEGATIAIDSDSAATASGNREDREAESGWRARGRGVDRRAVARAARRELAHRASHRGACRGTWPVAVIEPGDSGRLRHLWRALPNETRHRAPHEPVWKLPRQRGQPFHHHRAAANRRVVVDVPSQTR